jgi:hypothetical protein
MDNLASLEALRPYLRGESHEDLDVVLAIVREGIRRGNPRANAIIDLVVRQLLPVDPRFVAGPLAAAAKAAAHAVAAVRDARGGI